MEYKERINDLTATCTLIRATAETANSQLRDCLTDLGMKITQDNIGTRSYKDDAFNNLIESSSVLSEVEDVAGLIMEAFK